MLVVLRCTSVQFPILYVPADRWLLEISIPNLIQIFPETVCIPGIVRNIFMLTFLQWFKFKTSCEATDFDPFYSKTNLKCNFFGQNTISVLHLIPMLNAYQTVHLEKLDSFHPSQAQSQLAVATSLYDSDILMAAVLGAAGNLTLRWKVHIEKSLISYIFTYHILYIYTHTIYNIYNTHTHTIYI